MRSWKQRLGVAWLGCSLAAAGGPTSASAQQARDAAQFLNETQLAQEAFGADAPWYLENIPFLEIDDAEIQRTYYYRWQVYRSHLREIGPQGVDVTEFLASVPWAGHPYEDLNDSSSFHILEGRWLRNPAYVESLIEHLYAGGGNDRHFSESVAAASLAWTQVTGNPAPALRQLDAMRYVFNAWNDHFDRARNLYWIEPLLDATEYTISSIDASGAGFGEVGAQQGDGFTGGFAFRPSINAYQYGNARAIAAFAHMSGQLEVEKDYTLRAEALRSATLAQLWNPALQHFTDVYQRSTKTVKAGDFIRGRELVGLVPWQFELPPLHAAQNAPSYQIGWKHLVSTEALAGQYGVRTVEPSYARYKVQYRYDAATGLRECQWNGPSWPFQTSQMLSGLANLLQDYDDSAGMSSADYLHLLRQYTAQHRLPSGKLDLQEDYDPDLGGPIVGLPRSHHYNHSTYVDLVLSGLIGIRPHSDDLLEIRPLLPDRDSAERPIRYFAVQHLPYHGHDLTILFDVDGSRYHRGAGLTVFVDGQQAGPPSFGRIILPLPRAMPARNALRINLAVNPEAGPPSAFDAVTPIASASSGTASDGLYDPLDGRLWFFPEIRHGWSPKVGAGVQDKAREDWYAVDLRHPHLLGSVDLAFFAAQSEADLPLSIHIQVLAGGHWRNVAVRSQSAPVANGVTSIRFAPEQTDQLRVVMNMPAGSQPERLIHLGAFAP